MPDIYNILSKHFLKETSEIEEQQIKEFKKDNATEYKILKKLWNRGNLGIKDFNSAKAWDIVQDEVANKKLKTTRVIPLYKKLRQIAAIAAILIIGSFAAYYFVKENQITEIIAEQTSVTENTKVILLSDGSKVWLSRNASLTYPKKFGKLERVVELTGKAFFEISKNPKKPFIVNTHNSSIQVLGTSFNVNSNNEKTEVTVTTGTVKVINADKSNNVIITRGFSASVSGIEVNKYQTKNPNYMSWKTGEFVFNNVEIERVIEDLNTYYQEQLRIEGGTGNDCLLTVSFNKTKLQEVIDIIELTCDIKIIYNTNK
jgi:ferric-dicitrate binding protein FerR (iron transport regulator)